MGAMKLHLGSLLAAAALAAGCGTFPPASVGPARTDTLFSRVELGMTVDQVRSMLGAPDRVMPLRAETVAWDYDYMDGWGYFAVFSVTFDPAGRAVGRISWRTNDGGDHA